MSYEQTQKTSESRTKKFLKNSASMFINQLVVLISGFILPRVMISCYSSEINGLVSSIAQFVNYVCLVESGISAATVYALYKPLAEKDNEGISSIVSAAKNFYLKAGWIFFVVIAILAVLYPFFINVPDGMQYVDIVILVFVSSVSGVLDFFTLAKYRALLTADQKTYVLALATSVYTILNVLIITILAKTGQDICVVKSIALLSIVVRSLILIFYCKKKYPNINYKATPNNKALDKRWEALFQQVLSVVQNGAPIIILTVVCRDLVLVSIFSIFNMIMGGINSVLSIFISGLSASFGEIIAKNETETLQKTYKQFETIYYLLICVVYTIAFVTIMPFVSVYTAGINDANYCQPILGFLFVLNGFFYNLKTPQGMLVLSAGLYKETRYRSLIQALIVIILGIIGGYFFGIQGVLIGLIGSNVYRCFDLLLFIPKNVTKLSYLQTLKKWLIMLLNIAVIFVVFYFMPTFAINNYVAWIVHAIFVGLITIVVNGLSFFACFKEDMLALLKRFSKFARR